MEEKKNVASASADNSLFLEVMAEALAIQDRFSAEPIYARTGKGYLKSAGVEELAAIKKATQSLPNAFAETLRETLKQWPASQKDIAAATCIPAAYPSEMKSGKRRCTPEFDLRLSRFFTMTPGFWMRLQLNYEMQRASQKLGERITAEVQPAA